MDQPFQVHKDTLKASLTYAARKKRLDVFCKVPAVKLPEIVCSTQRTHPESIEFDTIKIAKVLGGVAASLNAPCHKMQLM